MKKEQRNIFKNLQEVLKSTTSGRWGDDADNHAFAVDQLVQLYKTNADSINLQLAVNNLNKLISSVDIIRGLDDPELFDGSWRYEGVFDGHYFGSVRNVNIIELVGIDWTYTIDDLKSGILNAGLGLTLDAIDLIAAVLFDIHGNGLHGIDCRNNQPDRLPLNEINIIVKYLHLNSGKLSGIINVLTFYKVDVLEAINYRRYRCKNSTSKKSVPVDVSLDKIPVPDDLFNDVE